MRQTAYALLLMLILAPTWAMDNDLSREQNQREQGRRLRGSYESRQWLMAHSDGLLEPAQVQKLYETLIRGYWVPETGLFLSFPGTGERRLSQQAATYDQAIVGILLLKLGDNAKVEALLDFYEKTWPLTLQRSGPRANKAGFSNFYNAHFGVEGVEKTMHVGPNAWIGLLASRWYRQSGDPKAKVLALNIAHWIIHQVPHTDGAVAMGEIAWNSTPWDQIYSTENNLSTYAFLTDLSHADGLSDDSRHDIALEREGIRHWMIRKAYDRQSGKVLRGFHPKGNDTVGAIDSYTWYLSALRPDYLDSNHIPVDELMRTASKEFTVQVDHHPGIDAIDQGMADATYQSDSAHPVDPLFLRPAVDQHRLIWYEGLGQYVVTLQDMAHYSVQQAFRHSDPAERQRLLTQAEIWLKQAETGARWMDEAAFDLPWGRVYPCATKGRFYLYGWPAPGPSAAHTSDAVAPLVWRLFAGLGYEPLNDIQLRPTATPHVQRVNTSAHEPGAALLYGASEEMLVRAWQLYEAKEPDAAIAQAKAAVDLWAADGRILEHRKEQEVGDYLPYDDGNTAEFQRIHDYWALNDVAAAYFIIGSIEHQRHNYPAAITAFTALLKDYSLAQIWDKRGWFWNPVDTLHNEYVEADQAHYGSLANLFPAAQGHNASLR